MKKYFLHNGTESSGPFNFEELIAKKITKKTPVWFEGMENWKYAGEIDELQSLFVITPPVAQPLNTVYTKQKKEKKTKETKIAGLSKNTFFITLTSIVLIVSTLIFNTYQGNRDRELGLKNHKTEVENHQYELLQKEIEDQKTALIDQENKEKERVAEENKQKDKNKLIEINNLISVAKENLKAAQDNLNDTSKFKLLRTAAEKNKQLNSLHLEIDSIKTEINNLINESNLLQLKMEKTY